MKSTSTVIVRMDRSFLPVMNAVVNYVGPFYVPYGVSFANARFKDIVDDIVPSRSLPNQSRSNHVRDVRFGPLKKINCDVLPLPESTSERREEVK